MCGLTHEDWMIMRGAIEDRHEPHRAATLSGMLSGHEADVDVMKSMTTYAAIDPPAAQVKDMMTYEVMGYTAAEHLIRPDARRNKWIGVRRYHASDRVWCYAENGYGGLDE